MKPFLGIDVTKNKSNEQFNGREFATATVSAIQSDMLDQAVDRASGVEEGAKLPKPLRIVRWICLFLALIGISGILRAEVTLAQAYANAPWIFWLSGGCLVIWAVLAFWGKRKERDAAQSDETRRVITAAEQLTNNSYAELGVPPTARNMDVLMFRYVEKNGEIIPRSFGPASFIGCDCKIFTENGVLCITDTKQRFEFPLSEMKRIVTSAKGGAIPTWNKNIPVNKPPYKEYRLRIDSYGFIHFKKYYILELEHDGESWGIYFPNYELPTIEALTGHHPQ